MVLLSIVDNKFKALFNSQLESYDLSFKTYNMLMKIVFREKISQSELTELTKTDKAAVTRGLNHLTKKGLVLRVKDEYDKRKTEISATEAGKKLFHELHDLHHDIFAVVLSGIDESGLDQFEATLNIIESNINDHQSRMSHE